MISGPKRKSVEEKKATGTYRPSRDTPKQIVVDVTPPSMPAFLPPDARIVWMEEINRVVQAGTCELDTTLFANYCCLAAQVRTLFQQHKTPRGNQLTELRKMGELLGIAGVPSRASRGRTSEPDNSNPFASLMGE